jgi:hypothetical protein
LHKLALQAGKIFKNFAVKAFIEKAAVIAEYLGREQNDVWDGKSGCLH